LLERPDLVKHPDFETVSLRLKNRDAMIEILEREFARRESADWVDALLAAGIPAGPLLSYPEAFESEHAQYRRMCMEIDHPIEGKVKNIGFPVKMLGTPQQVRRHPPRLGEHNDEIFAEIKRRAS
jgi:crotonobetainyl-CoA:carnitine CoA-transferase CaiB-like acyl-CoA transferase